MSAIIVTSSTIGLSTDVEPYEFWPYTTIVEDVAMELNASDAVANFQAGLVEVFRDNGIQAYLDNKTVFVVETFEGRLWYIGFKDGRCLLGCNARSDHQSGIKKS